MDNQKKQAFRDWEKFLNPEALQGNLITASIFLAAYEILRASIIDRIRDFFTRGFDENGLIINESYRNEVLSLDRSPLRASLLWLKESSAIGNAEIELVNAIREHRNELAHDLPKFIATADAEINIRLLGSIYDLVTQIDRWWIQEVEIPINSDFDGQEVNNKDIQSGNMLFLQIMIRTVTGEDFSAMWNEFQKQSG
jgi:hypothetical protein